MAVLKHIAIKNADYSAAVCYLKYQHDERHLKPLLDENGSMMLRSEFHMNGVNCNPDTFDLECEMLNDQYRKNYRYDEVKSHHYIISFDPRDKDEHNLTGEKAQTLGLEFVKNHLPGHQALVCTHTDGHNGSGNIHVHIIINSLRKLDIEPQSYTTRSIDCKAGYKHHLTKDYLKYLQQELMNLCQRENLYQVDLLSPAQRKITEAEYWLRKRGQKELEDINEQIIADGMNPMETTFQTRKQFVRNARQKTKDTETQIKSVNEQIHYLGQYLSTKSTYNEFLKARFKGKFRKDHADEIEKHEKAAQILKAQNPDGSLPKMKDLKLEKERLLALKAAQYDTYTYYKDYQKELRTACANVDNILGQHHIRDHTQRTEQTL